MHLKMSFRNYQKHVPGILNSSFILIWIGLSLVYVTCASLEQQRHIYSSNPRYPSDFERQPQYPNRYQQGQGFTSNFNNNNKNRQPSYRPDDGQQQYQERLLKNLGFQNYSSYNSPTGQESTKIRIWIPNEVFEKYPLAKKRNQNASTGQILIEICRKGYEPMNRGGNIHCRPLCDNCENGVCIKPGECQCHEGFIKNDNGDCIFTCPMGCLNGQCYLDGTCICDPGYKLDETRKFCRPICSGGCGQNERHNCTEPEVCGCSKGFRLTDNGCEPTCDPDCGYGGKCVVGSSGENICDCKSGMNLKDGVCQAECYQKCDNGICYGQNRCICNPGFRYHEGSTMCVPI